nr:carboxypeptidase-like regulatory domain-containing protein [Bernardetiaceae bacterium]
MKLIHWSFLMALVGFCLCQPKQTFSQAPAKVTLSGHIKDATTGEDLIGATVFLPEANTGQSTNVYGF